jgi:hypothetical protein
METILRRPGLISDYLRVWTLVEPWEQHIRASQVFGTEIAIRDMEQLKFRAGLNIDNLPEEDRMIVGFTDVMARIFSQRYKSKFESARTVSEVDENMRSIEERLQNVGENLDSLLKQIGSEREYGKKSALEYLNEVVVPFADQCKADLIVKEYEAEEKSIIERISSYMITFKTEWIEGRLRDELQKLSQRADEESNRGRDLTPAANHRLIAGINRVKEATMVKIKGIFEPHKKVARATELIEESMSAISKFTNKQESGELVPKMRAGVEEINGLGEGFSSEHMEKRKVEMERRAGLLEAEDSDDAREAKTLAYVLEMNKAEWFSTLRSHEQDKSLVGLDQSWEELQDTINKEVCSKMISGTACDRFIQGELKGVYDSVHGTIQKRIETAQKYKEKVAALDARALDLKKSAKTFDQLAHGIDALIAEAREYKDANGLSGQDEDVSFEDRMYQLVSEAKNEVLNPGNELPEGLDLHKPVELSDDQWTVAAELGAILKAGFTHSEPVEFPSNCPPESVQIGGKIVRFENCPHNKCTSTDEKFVWKRMAFMVYETDKIVALLAAKTREGANFVQQVPSASVTGISDECASVSKFEKSMTPLFSRSWGDVVWAIDTHDARNAIHVGINALKALEAIHSVGLVYGSAKMIFDMRLRMNGDDVPAWDQPDVLALDNLGSGSLFVNPEDHTHLSPYTSCAPRGQLYRLSPGEIQGYCSTRADDMYRLSEALFKSCGSFINTKGDRLAEEWIEIKREWEVKKDTLSPEIAYKESNAKYYEVLNEFHKAMFVLSNDRSMEKPDYESWIARFNAVLLE